MSSLKCVLLGDEQCGKTSMLASYISQAPCTIYQPTIGADLQMKTVVVGDVAHEVEIWCVTALSCLWRWGYCALA